MADIEEGIRPNLAPLCNKYSITSSVHRSATNTVLLALSSVHRSATNTVLLALSSVHRSATNTVLLAVLWIRVRIRKFLALPDPSIIKQKKE